MYGYIYIYIDLYYIYMLNLKNSLKNEIIEKQGLTVQKQQAG